MRREVHHRSWFGVPAILLVVLCGWCIYRSVNLPEPVATQLGEIVEKTPIRHIDEPSEVAEIQTSFRKTYAVNAAFCALGAAFWSFLILGSGIAGWFVPALTGLLFIQLICEVGLLPCKIFPGQTDIALSLVRRVVHHYQHLAFSRVCPGIGHESIPGPITLPGWQAFQQLPAARTQQR